MNVVAFWYASFFVVIILMKLGIVKLDRRNWPFTRIVLSAGTLLALFRLACLWHLQYLESTNRGDRDFLLLLPIFFPEGFLFMHDKPADHYVWTTWDTALFSLALAMGSYLFAALTTVVIRKIRRYAD